MFSRIAEPPRGGARRWTRRRAVKAGLFAAHPAARRFVEVFSGADTSDTPVVPLLRTGAGDTVEVCHERLFRCWPLLRDWLDAREADLSERVAAEFQAERWRVGGYRARDHDWRADRLLRLREVLAEFGLDEEVKQKQRALHAFLHPREKLLEVLDRDDTTPDERARIGDLLSELGEDDRPGVGLDADGLPDIVWVDVPGAPVALPPRWFDSPAVQWREQTEHSTRVEVSPFRMARYPVTEAQFRAFVDADDGYSNDDCWQGLPLERIDEAYPTAVRRPNYPRIDVAWNEAVAFCRWLTARRGLVIRLPGEREWQLAAGGAGEDGLPLRDYPWGDEPFDQSRANTNECGLGRRTAVGVFPRGATAQGGPEEVRIHDLAGLVWEWCLNAPESAEKTTDAMAAEDAPLRAVRGGAFDDVADVARSRIRSASHPHRRSSYIGFRVVCESPIE